MSEADTLQSSERDKPKLIPFGEISIPENFAISVDPQELANKREGFNNYKKLFSVPLTEEQRRFLLSTDVFSITTGFEAAKAMSPEFTAAWLNAMSRAGIDYSTDYGINCVPGIYKDQEYYEGFQPFWDVINIPEARRLLQSNSEIFSLASSSFPLTNEQVMEEYVRARTLEDDAQFHLRVGLLSGYPLGDCLRWNSVEKNLGRGGIFASRVATEDDLDALQRHARENPDILPNPDPFIDNTFRASRELHPRNRRNRRNRDDNHISLEGYGVIWGTLLADNGSVPPDTVEHCQKMLKIGNDLGAESFADAQENILRRQRVAKVFRRDKPM